jgi:nucleotide-binding universal stress UspA family protein
MTPALVRPRAEAEAIFLANRRLAMWAMRRTFHSRPDVEHRLLKSTRHYGEGRFMLPIKTVLHPTDFSEVSDTAFRLACGLASDHRGRLVILHVIPPPQSHGEVVARQDDGYHADIWRMLERMRPEEAALAVERRLEDGDPAETVLRVAGEEKADVIVLGTHGRGALGKLLLGSVADKVVRLAPCPVLTTNALSNTRGAS